MASKRSSSSKDGRLSGSNQSDVRLHAAQASFLMCPAIFRAFVGGVGSGKSWAGSYDLIKRAKPGRLYMVVAPTYGMLSDSTFRSFVAVATQLGVVNQSEIRKAAPPSVNLRTGAEIIFRSGDDPDRLYGPNLSGVWMDEASLMAKEVFEVAIGRLREGGEQGWLSATFTPKGLQHWTYETFATGRTNTAIFACRTSDNPFLPEQFYGNVAGQLTSRKAAQELEGQFISVEGALFDRNWFKVVEPASVPAMAKLCRGWDLASTPKDERKAHDPDWTVGALLGRDKDKDVYILDLKRLRGTPSQVQAAVTSCAYKDGKKTQIAMEEEGGSAGKVVSDHYLRLLQGYTFKAVRSTGSKADRATPLACQAEGGTVKVVRAAWNKDLLDEMEVFPFGAHDDIVDATSLAFSRLGALREFWIRGGPGEEPANPDDVWVVNEPGMGRQTIIPFGKDVLDVSANAPGWGRRI
jgi:predicted phage terminase large subunit-like protein